MGWFSSKCPVDKETQEWIDESFRWMIAEFGLDTLRSVEVILPTEEFFPDDFDGSRPSIRSMLERVCEYMDVDANLVDIRFDESEDVPEIHPLAAEGTERSHALGTYQKRCDGKYQISLNVTQVTNPEMLVATIAHELGHVILLGEDRLDPDHPGHEQLTDLVTVFYGLGIFNANTTVVFEQWTNPQYQGWRIGGGGYLTEEIFGYALGLFAALRNEVKPTWPRYLSTNVRSYFKDAAKYLEKSGSPLIESISAANESAV
jgi:hypothetical protein